MPTTRKLHDFFRDQSPICTTSFIDDLEGFRAVFVMEKTRLNFRVTFSAIQAFQSRDEMFTVAEFDRTSGIDGVGLYEVEGGSFLEYTKENSGAWPRESKQYTVVTDDQWIDVLCCREPIVETFRKD